MKKALHEASKYREIRSRKIHKRRSRKAKKEDGSLFFREGQEIRFPSKLNIFEQKERRPFLQSLDRVREVIASRKRHITLDFSGVSSIEAAAGILLRAEIERIKKLYNDVKFRGKPPRNLKCAQVMSQIGIASICSMKQQSGRYDDVIHWRAVSGNDVDGEKYATQLMAPYEQRLPNSLSTKLWIGASEAMTNVSHHAYIGNRDDGLRDAHFEERQWWMFSQERRSELQVVICDLGVGIPRTLPNSQKPELAAVVRWMRGKYRDDAEVLSAVLKKTAKSRPEARSSSETISRTGLPNRGRGLYNIVHAVRDIPDASVAVLSNRGAWVKRNSGERDGLKHAYKDSIKGTIIMWSVPTQKVKNSEEAHQD